MCELCATRIGQRMALLVQAGRPAIRLFRQVDHALPRQIGDQRGAGGGDGRCQRDTGLGFGGLQRGCGAGLSAPAGIRWIQSGAPPSGSDVD
jgi:hypothetical protein